MIEDFKNVIITFGLIGLVFMQGSYSYQNKIKSESTALAQQANIQKIKDNVIATKNKNLLLIQAKQQQDLLGQQLLQDQAVTSQNTPATAYSSQTAALLAQQEKDALLAKQKAQALLVQQQAQALAKQRAQQALAQAQANAAAQSTYVAPSRQSRAS
ncbi:MAG: hypothetical protein NTU81_00485 [Candidatus Nomurabacteria bacterium]|nr:hypothetical protein [Candidatus Nomurabacteria bacterium]